MRDALLAMSTYLTAQPVNPEQGTLQAAQGARQRMLEPNLYDAVFPVIAFVLVIVVPSAVALWVVYKTVTEKTVEDGES